MADRKAQNKYYPPDWDPSKGSINKHVGQHPLRDRARKLDQGILIVRFELPFNIWCGGCERHLARGVRFNAEKKQTGSYFSTPILSFRMKCPSCSGWIEIQTDPKNAEYVVVSGARRKMEGVEDLADVGIKRPKTKEEAEKLIYNPFFRIEHEFKDTSIAAAAKPQIEQMITNNEHVYKDDFKSSLTARKRLKLEKTQIEEEKKKMHDLKTRLDVHDLKMLPEDERDVVKAGDVKFEKEELRSDRVQRHATRLKSSSIFGGSPKGRLRLSNTSKSSSILDQLSLGGPKKKK